MNNEFLSKILQSLATLSAFAGLISQYLLQDTFRKLLNISKTDSFYEAFSLAGLVFGVVIIIAMFAYRYNLNSRFYIHKRQYKQYLGWLEKSRQQDEAELPRDDSTVLEPFYLDGARLAIISLAFGLVAFIALFYFQPPLIKSICYLVFLLTTIAALTVFILQLYMEDNWRKSEILRNDRILELINKQFAPTIRILERVEWGGLNSLIRIVIEVEGKQYEIHVDKNRPENTFTVQPHIRELDPDPVA